MGSAAIASYSTSWVICTCCGFEVDADAEVGSGAMIASGAAQHPASSATAVAIRANVI